MGVIGARVDWEHMETMGVMMSGEGDDEWRG